MLLIIAYVSNLSTQHADEISSFDFTLCYNIVYIWNYVLLVN